MRCGLLRMLVVGSIAAAPLAGRAAEPRVPTLPQHDVSVVYRLAGGARDAVPGGLPDTVRLQWQAGPARLRIEPQGRNQVLLVDLRVPRAELMDTGLHGVLTLPMRPKDVEPITLADARLTRRGSAVVAGLPCTEFDVADRRGTGTICFTADGLALRGAGTVDGRQGSFVALTVDAGPIAPSAFDVPRDFMRFTLPGMVGK